MITDILESETASRHEVSHRPRHEDLRGGRQGAHPRADVDGDPPHLPVDRLDLSCVNAGSDLQTDIGHRLGDRLGAAHGASRPVERREELVACGVDLVAPEPPEERTHHAVMALHERAPARIAHLGCLRRRAHDVSEQHRGEHPVQIRFLPTYGLGESLDLVEQLILPADEEEVILAGERDEARAIDLVRHPLVFFEGEGAIAVTRQHQRRHVDRRQGRAHIDLAVHARKGCGRPRARCMSQVVGQPCDRLLVAGERRRCPILDLLRCQLARSPARLAVRCVCLERLVVAAGPWVVGGRPPAGAGAEQDQPDRALRIRGGEHARHRTSLRDTEHDRTFRANGIHHRAGVVHPNLEGGKAVFGHPIRQPHAAFVEGDQPRERCQTFQESGERRLLPHLLDVARPAHHQDDVDGSGADRLIGDVHAVCGLRVPGLGHAHAGGSHVLVYRMFTISHRSPNRAR